MYRANRYGMIYSVTGITIGMGARVDCRGDIVKIAMRAK